MSRRAQRASRKYRCIRQQLVYYKVDSTKPGYDPAFAFLGQPKPMSPSKAVRKDHLLPPQPALRVQQVTGKVTAGALKSREHLIIVIPAKAPASLWKQLPEGSRLQMLVRKRKTGDGILHSRLHNHAATGISLQKLPGSDKGASCPAPFELLSFAGALAADALRDNPASLDIMVCGFDSAHAGTIVKALVLALAAHRFAMPSYKSGKQGKKRLKALRIVGMDEPFDVSRALIEAAATNLARWLTALPPNKLDAAAYRSILAQLAKDHGWRYDFLDEKHLKREGAGAFLAVSQGNRNRDAGIAHIRYVPKSMLNKGSTAKDEKSKNPAIALVGKGIIFDTGGTNLKPFKAMLDMHQDMAGSAVALATLIALTQLDYPATVDCWLAITENRISGDAYKPRDIVTAVNGTTIEVIHTDAEGRMALADTLALAGREAPRIMLDFATLTGTCVSALTERYSGAFTNRENLHSAIIAAGKDSGERVWPFPLDKDFDDEIKSEVADVLQCAAAGGGDHIQAARFLKRFVPDKTEWVHVDLSAASRKGGLAQVPGEITGFGVRFALNLLLDQPGVAGAPTGNTSA
jgi:leucyl aminopeptidase